jgi:hypothetical protein
MKAETCPNVGCVPSRMLAHYSDGKRTEDDVRRLPEYRAGQGEHEGPTGRLREGRPRSPGPPVHGKAFPSRRELCAVAGRVGAEAGRATERTRVS